MPEETAELPMLLFTLTKKPRPMIIGSLSGWLMLTGMMALQPLAVLERDLPHRDPELALQHPPRPRFDVILCYDLLFVSTGQPLF